MLGQPVGKINVARMHVRDTKLVASEEVGHDNQVSLISEIISEQLGIGINAKGVCQEDDGFLRGLIVLWVYNVGVDYGWC